MIYALIISMISTSLIASAGTMGFFGLIGFAIGTFKIPESSGLEISRKAGGENIDEVIIRAIKFKKKKNRVYVYTKEENK